MGNLPPGLAQRLQEIEDEEDEVDYRIPSSWGVESTSFNPSLGSSNATSSESNPFASSNSSQSHGFAPALASQSKKVSATGHYSNRFTFSTAVPTAPEKETLTTREFSSGGRDYRNQQSESSSTAGSEEISTSSGLKRIRALEATFGTELVTRVSEDEYGDLTPRTRSVRSGHSGSSAFTAGELDPHLENPELEIPDNIRANFLPINRLHEVYSRQSGYGPIATSLGGETIVYNPKRDTRLDHLDRNQNYIGKDLGPISKRLKRQHKEDVEERDRQMLQATAEWRAWSALNPEEITSLCEQLKKPIFFCGADEGDQYDSLEIPDIYTRKMSMERILSWMSENPTPESSKPGRTPSSQGDRNRSRSASVDSFQPLEQVSDDDEFLVREDFVPPKPPVNRTVEQARKFIQDALDFRKDGYALSVRSESSLFGGQSRPASVLGRREGSISGSSVRSLGTYDFSLSNPFTFDDSPELQEPVDYALPISENPSPQLFEKTTALSLTSGRVVQIHLHHPVKFTPGAIVSRVFSGVIQEMQLFPMQRLAIVIFLHPTEAKSFIRHVKSVSQYGNTHEIRMLQIDADWYK
jgi:hypothetical protein